MPPFVPRWQIVVVVNVVVVCVADVVELAGVSAGEVLWATRILLAVVS
jgi:hypothetical protein